MAKRKEDIENRTLTPVIPFRRPGVEDKPRPEVGLRCSECQSEISVGWDSYIIIDGESFCSDSCVTDHFIQEAGGRRVYGGAC